MISISIIVIVNVLMKKNKEKLDDDDKKSINMIIYCTLFVILQVLMPSISIYAFSTSIITSIVYLTYANPDIEITRELSKAQKTIKDSAKTKTDFLSNVTSEIKTPVSYITSLCTNLQNLEEYNVEEELLNQCELLFYEENPRVYSILRSNGTIPTQKEIEAKKEEAREERAAARAEAKAEREAGYIAIRSEKQRQLVSRIIEEELTAICEEDGRAEIACQFCDKKYVFTRHQLKELAK